MAAVSSNTIALERIHSSEDVGLLDAIDRLKSEGLSHYIPLPQLIVCGDQSSGKSSALEAISGIPFPTKDNLCTRFATELVLRRTSTPEVSVSIVPSQSRSESECQRLSEFRETLADLQEFPSLIEKAKDEMDTSAAASAFTSDVLRVEISGPDRPHLTIVDLPGLIHSENKQQSAADVELVRDLVHLYMENQRSIILAVVSAKNDYANQIVLKLAKEVDPQGLRTLGVITKPDTLPVGSESETLFVALAKNEDVDFRLGWHVLRNRDYESRNCSTETRDMLETRFFSQGIWQDLPRNLVGISALRKRLSKVLLDQIKSELPSLSADIAANIEDCRSKLSKLGSSRAGVDEQRLFLLRIGQSFQSLAKAAIDGTYGNTFFGDACSKEGYGKRLRSVVQNSNLDFAHSMRTRGHRYQIVEGNHNGKPTTIASSEDPGAHIGPKLIGRNEFISKVKEVLKRSRGRELPGMYSPMIVGDLFFEQSKPWEALARQHIRALWEATQAFLVLTIANLTDEYTSNSLLNELMYPLMEKKYTELDNKVTDLLAPYKTVHPITYNHYFTESVQNVRKERRKAEITKKIQSFCEKRDNYTLGTMMPSLISALVTENEADMDRYACSEVLDCMEAYYKVISSGSNTSQVMTDSICKVALKTFVDNVAVQAVESVLVADLADLISPSYVVQMESELISRIAAEPPENQDQRERLSRKLAVLQSGAEICKRYIGRTTSGMVILYSGIFKLLRPRFYRLWETSSETDAVIAGQSLSWHTKLSAPVRKGFKDGSPERQPKIEQVTQDEVLSS